MQKSEIWWANLREPIGSEPGYWHPVLIVSSDALNLSRVQTLIVVCLTTNHSRVGEPNQIVVSAESTGLERDSVINVTQIATIDKSMVSEFIGELDDDAMKVVETELRRVMLL